MDQDDPISPWPLLPLDARVLGGLRQRISQYSDGRTIILVPRKTVKWSREESSIPTLQPSGSNPPPVGGCKGAGDCFTIGGAPIDCGDPSTGPDRVFTICDNCCSNLDALGVGAFVTMTICQIYDCFDVTYDPDTNTTTINFNGKTFDAVYLSTYPSTTSFPCEGCCDLYTVSRTT